MANNFLENIYNFASNRLKTYMYEILKERYPKHEDFFERLGHSLPLEQDVRNFTELIIDVYELGYLKALTDYEGEFKKLGYNVKIVPPEKPETHKSIFK